MSLYRKNLGRGIFYNHLQTDLFKTSSFSVNFVLPLRKETVAAYTVLPMVLHRGCSSYPDRRAIARQLEELYGTALSVRNYKRGELQVINFTVNMIDNAYLPKTEDIDLLKEALSLLSDMLFDPVLENGHLLDAYVESEIRNCKDAIRAAINNKMRYAYDRCIELMFDGEHYGIPADGYLEDYDALNADIFMQAYRSLLAEARIEIFYGGKESAKHVEKLADDLFKTQDRSSEGEHIPDTQIFPTVKNVRDFEESTPAEQGKLVMGFRTPITGKHPNAYAFTVFNEIYGGSASSKLFMNVREKKSLCYSCSSTADLSKGALFAYAGIDNANKEVTIAEILKQLDNIRQSDITDDELNCAKKSLVSGYQALSDSLASMEIWYLRHILCDFQQEPEDAIKQIMNVTREDVAAIAKQISLDTVYFLKGDKNALCFSADDGEEEEDEG